MNRTQLLYVRLYFWGKTKTGQRNFYLRCFSDPQQLFFINVSRSVAWCHKFFIQILQSAKKYFCRGSVAEPEQGPA